MPPFQAGGRRYISDCSETFLAQAVSCLTGITQHRKARFVLMAMEDFERLKAANPDPRRAYRADETPPELAGLFVAGLDRIIDGTDEADGR